MALTADEAGPGTTQAARRSCGPLLGEAGVGMAGAGGEGVSVRPGDAPAPVRYTLLAALCHVREAEITDSLVDLFIQLVQKINTQAEKKVEGESVRSSRRSAARRR
ncbi:hypothetical protein ACFZCG_19215 [Streptomyces tanashiensis]|uniref:hypothetical protein n=1 Tax=Streptomyces tanashiensis TaxID=67367 RepID=UPI0036EFEF3A